MMAKNFKHDEGEKMSAKLSRNRMELTLLGGAGDRGIPSELTLRLPITSTLELLETINRLEGEYRQEPK